MACPGLDPGPWSQGPLTGSGEGNQPLAATLVQYMTLLSPWGPCDVSSPTGVQQTQAQHLQSHCLGTQCQRWLNCWVQPPKIRSCTLLLLMLGFCEVNQWIPNKTENASDAKPPHCLLHESGHYHEDIWGLSGTGLMSADHTKSHSSPHGVCYASGPE